MILEIARINVSPDQTGRFEAAFEQARKVIAQAEGCHSVNLVRSLETPGRYLLHVEWPTIAHHMEGFRNSELFKQWRALLGPYFAEAPEVEHFEFLR